MPPRLASKPCRICGKPVVPVLRRTRKAYIYPRQCPDCRGRYRDPVAHRARISAATVGRNNPRHLPVGSTRLRVCGTKTYRFVKSAEPNVWRYEHRAVLEAHLGRPLRRGEHVHHRNGDPLDNRPENLEALTAAEHNRREFTLTRWSRGHDVCIVCGSSHRRHISRGYCSACYQRVFYKSTKRKKIYLPYGVPI